MKIARWVMGGMFVATLPLWAEKTTVVQAVTREGVWTGWGYSGAPATENFPGISQAPAKFRLVENSRTFSGIVSGLRSTEGVEIGIVSLNGAHWTNPRNYQWKAIESDGSFSITSDSFPEAGKTLVVRGPKLAWTFLPHDFRPGEGAADIVIPASESRKVRFSAGPNPTESINDASFQIFPILREFGNDGRPLRRQRIGEQHSKDQSSTELWLPTTPVGVLASAPGRASYYQAIDPRAADHFHFVLQTGGTLRIKVLDRVGNPKPGVNIRWMNPGAPYSLVEGKTNPEGILERPHLSAGEFQIKADGFPNARAVVKNDQSTELILQVGKAVE